MSDKPTPAQSKDYAKQSRQIWVIGSCLMLGALVNFGIYSLIASTASHMVLCLVVAFVQISFQLFGFMHLKNESGFILKVLVITAILVTVMIFLNMLAHANPLQSPYISL